MRHNTLIVINGLLWLAIGLMLLVVGIKLTLQAIAPPSLPFSPITWATTFISDRVQAALFIITIALYIGYLKARLVLKRTAARQIERLSAKTLPLTLRDLYGPSSLLLVGAMVGLGFVLRALPCSCDFRGFIDVAIGSALIQSSTHYFRHCFIRTQNS